MDLEDAIRESQPLARTLECQSITGDMFRRKLGEMNLMRCKIEWGEFLSTRDAAFVRGSLLGAGVASHIRPDVGCDARSAFTELNHRVSEITRSQDRSVQTAQLK